MALAIRMARGGSKKRPYFRIVVADARSPRDGRFIEKIGTNNPMLAKDDANRIVLDVERAKHWISNGAQPTDRVARILEAAGVIEKKVRNNPNKGLPGKKALQRVEDQKAKAEAAVAAAAAEVEAAAAAKVAAAEAAAAAVEAAKVAAAAPAEEAPVEAAAEEAPAEAAAEEAKAE